MLFQTDAVQLSNFWQNEICNSEDLVSDFKK